MRAWLALVLLASTGLAQGRIYNRNCNVASRRSTRGSVDCSIPGIALFRAATASGAGMGTACAGVNPTGVDGGAIVTVRASTEWCTKGNESRLIAEGDMVEMPANVPSVMPGGDGTGPLGLLSWDVVDNRCIRSCEFDSASWTHEPVGEVTVTADAANGPCGAITATCLGADRVQFLATSGSQQQLLYRVFTVTGTTSSSIYVRGVSGAGTIDLCPSSGCAPCAFVSTSWTRCKVDGSPGPFTSIAFGNNSLSDGGTRAAADVYLWGAQVNPGTLVGPFVTTTSVIASKAADDIRFNPGTIWSSPATFSMAATYTPTAMDSSVRRLLSYYVDSTHAVRLSIQATTGTASLTTTNVTNITTNSVQTVTLNAENRLAGYFDGLLRGECINSSCATHAGSNTTPPIGPATGEIGFLNVGAAPAASGSMANGVVKDICLSTNAAACR